LEGIDSLAPDDAAKPLAGLALGFAVPTIAQDQNTIDPEVRQQIQALFVKFDDSFNKNDVDAMTSFYTQDAAVVNERLSEGGASVGRSAIEKMYTVEFASKPYNLVNKLVHVHPIGNEICAISEWSVTHTNGQSVTICVRDAGDWKIRLHYHN
jgi:uncharacterized protein (TIGR02246 family)